MTAKMFFEIFAIECRRLMSYRADFWVNALMNFVAGIMVPYFLWGAMYKMSDSTTIGGYSYEAMLVYICMVTLLGRVVRGTDQLSDVATDIYEGGLNRYLLYPAPYLPFKYAQHLGNLLPQMIQLFVFVPLIAVVVGIPDDVTISAASIAATVAAVFLANLLYYLLAFPLQGVAFWADNVWSLGVMLRMASRLLGGALVPLALFPPAAQGVLAWLPFRALYDFPVNTLMGKLTFEEWCAGMALSLGWCGALMAIGALVWRRGQRVYTGVGI